MDAIIQTKKEENEEKEYNKDKWEFLKNPKWVQTILMTIVIFAGIAYHMPTLDKNIAEFMINLTSMKVSTLITTITFIAMMEALILMLIYSWTGGITLRIVLAKLFRRKTIIELSEDGVYDIKVVSKVKKGFWHVKGILYEVDKEALGWFKNGVMTAPILQGYNRLIAFSRVRDNSDIIQDPDKYDDHTKAIRVEERRKVQQGFLSPQNLAPLAMVFMAIGVCGYLLIGQMQQSNLQGELMQCYKECKPVVDEVVKDTINKTIETTTTTLIPFINMIR
jgi:hypothetical protein